MTPIDEPATKAVLIPLSQLRANEAYQPRVDGLKESHVRLLMVSDPATWPPLLVSPNEDGTYDIIEGFHRHEAGNRMGLDALSCIIDPTAGYPEAVAANLAHGLPLSLPDRKAFAQWLAEEEPELSLREIGRRCGLHHETVRRALEELEPTGGQNRQSTSDPIAKLVRQVERTYHTGSGRSMFGFGKAGNPAPFTSSLRTTLLSISTIMVSLRSLRHSLTCPFTCTVPTPRLLHSPGGITACLCLSFALFSPVRRLWRLVGCG